MEFWDTAGDWFLWVLALLVFVAALYVLFAIVRDLFRDRALNGWAKVGWMLVLTFLPVLGSLVYLVVRGKGMSERTALIAAYDDDEGSRLLDLHSPSYEVGVARSLLDSGRITHAEYEQLRREAVSPPDLDD